MQPSNTIIKFLKRPIERAAAEGATLYDIFTGRLREALGRILNWLGVPGTIQDLKITDELTGQHIEIRVGLLFTRVSVNGRDYFFRRLSGRFDGTGMGCY